MGFQHQYWSSTDTLDLQRIGGLTKVSSTPTPWLATLVSSGEVGWFVYILNDVFSLFTGDATASYGWKHPAMVWGIAAVWGLASPVRYCATLDRLCTVQSVDFAATCTSATIQIGRFSRFCGLLGISVVCGGVCFAFDRYTLHMTTTTHSVNSADKTRPTTPGSKFLSASAHYMFESGQWRVNGLYFLDRASAVITGLVCVQVGHKLYVVDVKKWRAFALDMTGFRQDVDAMLSKHLFARAIPLVE
ncbi:hypothetical protein H257_03968 [Aphanomyces astaci]|uniref:Uncharacterized protein n=1 Tax=Aphanomyces astaci TaxID=112090 RepID=W4GW88_APHAT|nr:hypothetical protein H257_03968 [Aphanomyces astaci]ETV83168.1 hypothetical protein H257_03968 [Aphanomyces astaci]|eukprot:XP_009826598.1 hypothetical protein H257_03968 [Aphanomyces astaci]